MEKEKLSKIISHALRHKPEYYNLKLSKNGWVSIDELVKGIKAKNIEYLSLEADSIIKLVIEATKKRHEISNGQIRALHGHSLKIQNEAPLVIPSSKLFHATAIKYWDKIKKDGLDKMGRNFVHLSILKPYAVEVAKKKYRNIALLQIDAVKASEDGILFYSNDKGLTFLCEHVSPQYISIVIE